MQCKNGIATHFQIFEHDVTRTKKRPKRDSFKTARSKLKEKNFTVLCDNRTSNNSEILQLYENYTIIWLSNESTDLNFELISCCRTIISHIELITGIHKCIEYLSSINKCLQQIFLVVSGTFDKIDLDELLDQITELNGLVYFWNSECGVSANCGKYRSFINQDELIAKIANDFYKVKGNKADGMSTRDFDVNNIRYKCFKLLMDVLQRMPPPRETAKENMIKYCEMTCQIKSDERVEEFRNRYTGDKAILWYSSQSFFKKIFDRDLRSTDFNLISNFSFYLADLYNALHNKFKSSSTSSNDFVVYRGLKLPKFELEELKANVGRFISNNTFLSTTCKRDTALHYAMNINDNPANQSVLFDIHINGKNNQHPFADISDISHIDGEVLLSVGTVFRIDSVCEPQSNEKNNIHIWNICLSSYEQKLSVLDDYFDIVLLRLIEILRCISPDSDRVNNKLLQRCRLYYSHDPSELRKIDDFEKHYTSDQAMRWYTKDSFLFRIMNAAFRQNDMTTIIDLRFFIIDLYNELIKCQMEYIRTLPKNAQQQIILYRGQLMSNIELTKLQKSIGNYVSINSFFSTSTNETVALMYSGYGLNRSTSSLKSVLFIITVNLYEITDTKKFLRRAIFSEMNHFSDFNDEEEILLSNQNIFLLNRIEKRSDYPVWAIHMKLCIDDQYLDNTEQYIDIILSPIIHVDLHKKKLTFH